ncbi:MAG: hypothetical protein ACRC1K_17355 [Planctomycetia bacterium]
MSIAPTQNWIGGFPSDDDRRWRAPLWATLLLGAGWLVYRATADPGLAGLVVCLHFGGDDWRTAAWLRRHDPRPGRGAACFWTYLAAGLWKVCVAATVVVFAAALLLQGPPGGGFVANVLPMVLLEAAAAVLLTTAATYTGLTIARRHGVRVWVGRDVHDARRGGYWPPTAGRFAGVPPDLATAADNRGFDLAAVAVFVTLTVLGVLAGALVVGGAAFLFKQPVGLFPAVVELYIVAACGVTLIVYQSTVVLTLRDRVLLPALAETPCDCWTDDEPEADAP